MTAVLASPVRLDGGSARLKLDLLCLGARLPDAAFVTERGGRPLLRTRAGLGSGLELILPGDRGAGDLHVNVAVTEPFAQASPYRIEPCAAGDQVRVLLEDREVALARLAPRPRWYDATTRSGKPMSRVATLQGTVLAVYPGRVCDFWVRSEHRAAPESCRFCSVGLNLGADDDPEKSADDVLEAAHAARRESGVTYVDLNAGHADDAGFLDRLLPLARRLKRETGLLVGVQTPPHPDAARWAALREAGVNRVSFCFELFDPERFREVCPGKARVYGQRAFFDAIDTCLGLPRRRRWLPPLLDSLLSPWVVNGEIIAGLEPPSRSLEAIDWLTSRGAIPTVCCFRPLVGTALASEPPPSPEALLPVFQHLYRASLAQRLPIGVAPNIHVSLVLLPDEAAGLVPDSALTASERRWARALVRRRRAFAWLRGRRSA